MAIMKLMNSQKSIEYDGTLSGRVPHQLGTEDDIAQECCLALIKCADEFRAPFDLATIDRMLVTACGGAPREGTGSLLNGYLYQMLFYGVHDQARRKSNITTGTDFIGENDEEAIFQVAQPVDNRFAGTKPDNVRQNVSRFLNLDIAMKIQDEYLNTKKYKGKPLREVFGSWTPLDEATGRCNQKDRPDRNNSNLQRALQMQVVKISKFFLEAKRKIISPTDSPDDTLIHSSIWLNQPLWEFAKPRRKLAARGSHENTSGRD